jgi:hypothetical protein
MTNKKVAAVPKMIDLVSNGSDKSTERVSGNNVKYKLPPSLAKLNKKSKPSPGTVQAPLPKYFSKNAPK